MESQPKSRRPSSASADARMKKIYGKTVESRVSTKIDSSVSSDRALRASQLEDKRRKSILDDKAHARRHSKRSSTSSGTKLRPKSASRERPRPKIKKNSPPARSKSAQISRSSSPTPKSEKDKKSKDDSETGDSLSRNFSNNSPNDLHDPESDSDEKVVSSNPNPAFQKSNDDAVQEDALRELPPPSIKSGDPQDTMLAEKGELHFALLEKNVMRGVWDDGYVTVTAVLGEAKEIGLRAWDTITAVNGKSLSSLKSADDFAAFYSAAERPLELVIKRPSEPPRKTFIIECGASTSCGLSVSYKRRVDGTPIIVSRALNEAAEAGFTVGDEIIELNGENVTGFSSGPFIKLFKSSARPLSVTALQRRGPPVQKKE